ncbi:MAG: hypothetical protein VX527_05805, partial [Planctomycetota bacterium]|nr:hypothetical protein [Planctomycetota bacterium]
PPVLDVLTDNTILAAATMPSASPRRFWTSNYVGIGPNADDAVMCAMAPIVTTGGDCNLTRATIDIPGDLNEPAGYISQEMQQRSYTNNFGNLFDGSKAATAQIAAVAACIQGLSLQWYGGHQIPENLRALLYDTKRIKGSLTNPPFQQPFPADSFGKAGAPWATDLVGPTEGPDGTPFVGGWIDPSAAGVELVINPFYQVEPTQTDIITAYFIRGYQLYGDITSLESRFDYEFLSALSQYTVGGVPIEVDPYVPGQPIIYGEEPYPEIETGEWTDLFIHGIEENKDFVNNAVGIAIDVSFKIEPESVLDKAHRYNALMYNFQAEAWQDFEVATATFDDFTATYNLVYKPADGVYFGNYFGQGNEFNMRFTFNTFAQFVDPDEPFEDEVEFEAEPFVIYYDLIHLREDGVVVP